MVRNRKLFWWGGGVFTLLLAYASLSAAPGGRHSHFGPPHGPPSPFRNAMLGHMGRMMVLHSEINITQEQQEKLAGIMKEHHGEVQPAVKDFILAVRNLRNKMVADQPQETEIRAAASELGKAIGDAAILASKGVGEAKAVMTTDQLALVKNFLSDEDRSLDKMLEEMKKLPDFLHH